MENKITSRLHKKDIFTIPNILSIVRILLIPVIIILYCRYQMYYKAVGVILLSGLTDIADGFIARKFNMISDFGKFIDPVADKLTQAALIICLMTRYSAMGLLILLMVLKESLLFIGGFIMLQLTDTVNSAKWYGKVSTLIMYTVMVVLFLFPSLPTPLVSFCTALCAVALIGSMLLYGRFFYSLLKKSNPNKQAGISTLLWKCILLIDWIAFTALFFYYAKGISLEKILHFKPQNIILAVIVMLLLFAFKSISLIIYIGILYAISGLVFSPVLAAAVNILGTVIALSIPYALGKKAGKPKIEELTAKYTAVRAAVENNHRNDFLFALITRLFAGLPMDVTGMFMGATNVQYFKYLTGSMLGLLPRLIAYTIIGATVTTPRSPIFLIALGVGICILISTACVRLYKHNRNHQI